jgi:DNA-binding CsgD family transcriptional regulator
VKFHLTNIYRKLGVSSRTEAVHWAYRHGLLEASLDAAAPALL